jgi:hypothetical protein
MVNEKFRHLDAKKVEEIHSGSKQERAWDTARYSRTSGPSSPLEELFRGYSRRTLPDSLVITRPDSESTSLKANTQIEVSSPTTTLTEIDSKAYTLGEDIESLKKQGLYGKVLVLKPPDESFNCHQLTFFNGVGDKGAGKNKITEEELMRYIEKDFHLLATKDQYEGNPSLYENLDHKLNEDNRKYKDHYIVVYRKDGEIPPHTSPLAEVYRKEDGTLSIKVWGKWGRRRSTFIHDIEDVPTYYKDQGETKWEIRFTDRPNGRIMDL